MTLGIGEAVDPLNHPLSWTCFCPPFILIVGVQAKQFFFSERFTADR
jgi:hypothetical protein